MKKIFLFADYKQAESRVVAWYGPVPQLKDAYKRGDDIHITVAKQIGKVVQENKLILPEKLFMKTPWMELSAKDKAERQAGKTTGHAGNYGIEKNTLAASLGMAANHAELILAIYHRQFPGVKEGYQRKIQDLVKQTRTVVTPFGRPITFYDLYSDSMLRAAYAYYGQSTVGDLLTQLIRRSCEHFRELKFDGSIVLTPATVRKGGFDIRINAHDAVGMILPDDREAIEYAIKILKLYGEIPISIEGDDLIIPLDFKTGYNWGELKDYEL